MPYGQVNARRSKLALRWLSRTLKENFFRDRKLYIVGFQAPFESVTVQIT